MADETASTATSEQTTETAATTTDAAATGATETGATTEAAATEDLATALGGAGETTESKTDDAGAGTKAEVPEAYELAAPEGFEKLDEETVAAATPVFKELGLSNEQANKLVPIAGEFAKKIVAQRDQQLIGEIMQQRKGWLETAKADTEIGGAKWDESIQAAGRAFDRLGFPKDSPLRVALNESGFGNHPEMIRFAAKVGNAIGEDSDFVRGDAGAGVKPKTAEEVFWPGQSGQKA